MTYMKKEIVLSIFKFSIRSGLCCLKIKLMDNQTIYSPHNLLHCMVWFVGMDDGISTIRRTINTETKGSKWSINNSKSTHEKVKELMHSLTIDMNNLCSFMPQDKVGMFSQESAKGILQMTLKAIKEKQLDNCASTNTLKTIETEKTLFDTQMKLAKEEKHKTDHEIKLNLKIAAQVSLEKRIANMKTQVELIQHREDIIINLKYYKIKTLYKELDEAISQSKTKQKVVDEANCALATASTAIKPLEEAERQSKRKLAETDAISESFYKKLVHNEDKCIKLLDYINNSEICIDNVLAKIEMLEQSRYKDQAAYNKCCQNINKYQTELTEAVQQTAITKTEIAQINTMINEKYDLERTLLDAVDSLHRERTEVNFELSNKTKELNNMKSPTQLFKIRLSSLGE